LGGGSRGGGGGRGDREDVGWERYRKVGVEELVSLRNSAVDDDDDWRLGDSGANKW